MQIWSEKLDMKPKLMNESNFIVKCTYRETNSSKIKILEYNCDE